MDFQSFYPQAKDLNCDQHNNKKDDVDLSLKLGVPSGSNDQNQAQLFDFVPNMSPHGQANFNNRDHQNYQQGTTNHYFMRNNAQSNLHGFGGQCFVGSSSATAAPFYFNRSQPQTNSCFNMNPNGPPLRAMNSYTILNHFPTRRVNRSGSSSLSPSGLGRQLGYQDSPQRCSNYNCKAEYTPLWRKGPLGLKTLCNACGLKYFRMEGKKKKAIKAASRSRLHGQESNN